MDPHQMAFVSFVEAPILFSPILVSQEDLRPSHRCVRASYKARLQTQIILNSKREELNHGNGDLRGMNFLLSRERGLYHFTLTLTLRSMFFFFSFFYHKLMKEKPSLSHYNPTRMANLDAHSSEILENASHRLAQAYDKCLPRLFYHH